jgi:hypothetical protein
VAEEAGPATAELVIEDAKTPLAFTTDSTSDAELEVDGNAVIKGDLKVEGTVKTTTIEATEASPKPEPEKSDPEPAAEESAPETPEKAEEIPDEKPATEAEMREAFIAENPGRKAIHGGYETKRYTAWKSQHGYE